MKKFKPNLSAILISAILVSCNPSKNNNNIEEMDFDSFKRWGSSDVLTQETSRSGNWSTYVDSLHEFSLTYERPLSELLAKGYKKVTFSAWVFDLNNVNDVKAVITIGSPTGVNYAWQGCDVSTSTEVDNKGWKKVSVGIDLIKEVPEAKLKAYFWSPKKEKLIIDDVMLEYN